MALVVTHAFTATAGDTAGAAAAGKVVASEWNAAHTLAGIASSSQGGTGNGFTKFTGPTTSEKTFTLPDASSTLLYDGGSASSYKLNSSGIITDSSTSRTLGASDNGVVLYFTSGSAITLSMASGLGAGFSCTVLQGGAGQITFAANSQAMTVAGGLTKTAYVGATALILAAAANTFFISGTLA